MIINSFPPNIDKIRETFDLRGRPGIVFTFGGNIYNPSGLNMSEDLVAHEEVHIKQQLSMGPEIWWEKYLENPEFRLEQELEAYRVQNEVLKKQPRPVRRRVLAHICNELSSKMYGNIISSEEAKKQITNVL